MFEDKKGSEMIRMHAQKDYDVTVHHVETRKIGEDGVAGASRNTTLITGDDVLTIATGSQTVTVARSMSPKRSAWRRRPRSGWRVDHDRRYGHAHRHRTDRDHFGGEHHADLRREHDHHDAGLDHDPGADRADPGQRQRRRSPDR